MRHPNGFPQQTAARVEQLIRSGTNPKDAVNTVASECGYSHKSVSTYCSDFIKPSYSHLLAQAHAGQFSASTQPAVSANQPDPVPNQNPALPDSLFTAIKTKPRSAADLARMFGASESEIRAAIADLRQRPLAIDEFDGRFQLSRQLQPVELPLRIDISKHPETLVPFGCVADTHLGSKYERLDVLEALYDRFQQEGVTTVYHAGNWIDGESKFNKFDLYVHGFKAQLENFIAKYPHRKGITTHLISGDDHEGWYVQREHIPVGDALVGAALKANRTDLVDLGYMERDVELLQEAGSSTLRIIHAGGGSSYATSYTSQKYAETLQGGEKPSIVLVGHFHKLAYDYPREIHMIQVGCTQDQTPFMRKRRLTAMVGGVILWIRQARNGIISSVRPEFFPFYDKKFYRYNW